VLYSVVYLFIKNMADPVICEVLPILRVGAYF